MVGTKWRASRVRPGSSRRVSWARRSWRVAGGGLLLAFLVLQTPLTMVGDKQLPMAAVTATLQTIFAARTTSVPDPIAPDPIAPAPIAPVQPTIAAVLPATAVMATQAANDIIVRAGTVTVSAEQPLVDVPLDLLGATDALPLGTLHVDLHYDTARLQVVACTVGAGFDLLLCNPDTAGVIRLAGVAANGIRADQRLADLRFALLQPVDLATPLNIQVDAAADVHGLGVNAIGQPGALIQNCTGANGSCQNIFLPNIWR
ncbi:MAG: hypothetical protein KF832_27055 [Caldilineaceae bacterium]|nr:hypothetical protein [Caldilineaceae bacterium]